MTIVKEASYLKRTNPALTTRKQTGCGTLHITLVYSEETFDPLSFQFILGKAGGCAASQLNGIQTLVNYCIKSKLPLEPLYDKHSNYALTGIRCPEIMSDDEEFANAPDEKLNLSCCDVVAKSMKYLLGKLNELKPKK